MNTKVFNYRVIIEKEKHKKGYVYVAYAPSLGVSDFGKTTDEAVGHISNAIKLYIETLIELKKQIPHPDSDEYFITTSKIKIALPQLIYPDD